MGAVITATLPGPLRAPGSRLRLHPLLHLVLRAPVGVSRSLSLLHRWQAEVRCGFLMSPGHQEGEALSRQQASCSSSSQIVGLPAAPQCLLRLEGEAPAPWRGRG